MIKSDRKSGKKRERSAACWEQTIRGLPLWLPSLDKEGKPGATGHGGGGSNSRREATSVAGLQRLARPQSLYVTDVAGRPLLRATSPPQPRGDFSCNLPARDRNWTKTSDAGCEVTTSRKGGSRRPLVFRVKDCS